MSYSEYDRFKWEVLAELPHRFGLDAPWFEAKKLAPGDHEAQAQLVRRVVLELFDDGLIFCAYASRDEGYRLQLQEFVSVEREALQKELSRPPDYVEPEDRLFWLLPTGRGLELLDSLPDEAFLHENIEVWVKRMRREHPGFLEKRDQYLRDMVAWVERGGERPRPPEWPV